MPTDTLADLDPAPAGDQRFDPHGPSAERILTAAVAGPPAPAGARQGTTRGPRVALVAATAVAVAGVAVVAGVGLGGPDADPLRPAAALAAAVERTAAFDSGVAHIHTVVRNPDGSLYLDARHDVRFSRDASETTQHAAPGSPGSGSSMDGASWRNVAGRSWLRQGDGGWRPMPDAAPHDPLADEARTIVGDRALAGLVRSTEGVTQDGSTFRVTLSGDAIRSLPRPPFALGELGDLDRVHLTMRLAADETIADLTVAYGDVTRTITYEALGEAQDIPAP